MKICPICKKSLNRGQRIAVIAAPLICKDNHSNYTLIPDFVDKEEIYHYRCYKNHFHFDIIEGDTQLGKEFQEVLKSLGESPSLTQIMEFLNDNPTLFEIDELLNIWFKEKR